MTQDRIQHIIIQAKEGNQRAFNSLLDFYWRDVYNFQLKLTQDENDAEDICIQTFSKAFDKLDTFDDQYNFKTWLITISKNIHIDLLRKQKKVPTKNSITEDHYVAQSVVDETPTPEDDIIKEQQLNNLLKHITKLKLHYREIINLRYFQQMSYADIAEHLNQPLNSIKVKLLRAKKLLAESIQSEKDAV